MEFKAYIDGACQGNPGPGGWGVVLVYDGEKKALSGKVKDTTNNRMEMLAAIKALESIPAGESVTIHSDSQYLVHTMTKGWKRRANQAFWQKLDSLCQGHKVSWKWHFGESLPELAEAHRLASKEAGMETAEAQSSLTHLAPSGRARMVDVTPKEETEREAVARGVVRMKPQTLALVREKGIEKGDVLAVAQIAGIAAAKETSRLIPLCHPLPLTHVQVDFNLLEDAIEIMARAKTTARTGVEMEALTAVAVSALTIYDMVKGVDPTPRIEAIRLVSKSGGKSGQVTLEE